MNNVLEGFPGGKEKSILEYRFLGKVACSSGVNKKNQKKRSPTFAVGSVGGKSWLFTSPEKKTENPVPLEPPNIEGSL